MRIEYRGERPSIHPEAWVAPTAVLSGDVRVGAGSRVLFGAVLTAEGGPVEIGERCVVMEHAVIRGSRRHPVRIGDHVLIGPRASLSGCTVADRVFLATGATVFNGAMIERGSEVRVNGVVHLKTRVPAGSTVPIGWVAVGDPAEILPPFEHDRIWAVQQALDFPQEVFGLERGDDPAALIEAITDRYCRALGAHRDDRIVDEDPAPAPDGRRTMPETSPGGGGT
ncbi:MAG TPA: gamma carbonic anhydrase family protein [Actinomycetota bacterium]|nr:gamma carbonic anhydrase family protein [Actinomycetota bacterium]